MLERQTKFQLTRIGKNTDRIPILSVLFPIRVTDFGSGLSRLALPIQDDAQRRLAFLGNETPSISGLGHGKMVGDQRQGLQVTGGDQGERRVHARL